MADRFDVVIVGGGPAGSSTAMHLRKARPGTRIAIVDRARFPREKPCGGAVSRWGLQVLAELSLTLDRLDVDAVPIRALRVRCAQLMGEHRLLARERSLGAVVRRRELDAALLAESARRGVTVVEGARVVAIEESFDRVAVRLEDGRRIEGELLVGADGTGSAVRRLGGFDEPGRRAQLVVTETAGVAVDDVFRDDGGVLEFELPIGHDGSVESYRWSFATRIAGQPRVSRGAFVFPRAHAADTPSARSPRRDLDELLDERHLSIEPRTVAAYSERIFFDERSPAAAGRALLVGEAAGLVDPITGEGIAQALASGRIAAAALAGALAVGGSIDAEAYRLALAAERFHRHLRISARIAPFVYGPLGSTLGVALASSSSAMAASARWYAGEHLGLLRKAGTGVSFAGAAVHRSLRHAATVLLSRNRHAAALR